MKDDMKKNITELAPERLQIVCVERLDDLVCLFNETVPDGLVRLLPVPRTVAAEAPYNLHKPLELSCRDGGIALRHENGSPVNTD